MTRRQFASLSAKAAALSAIATSNDSLFSASPASLASRASAKGIVYGASSSRRFLSTDQVLAQVFVAQCRLLVPEWEFQWSNLSPQFGQVDFSATDWMLQFAQAHDLLLRGHALVWYQGVPKWFDSKVSSVNVEQILQEHIRSVASRYAGKMQSWDVVNEVVAIWDKRSDGLRNSPWLQMLGPDYIAIAFHAARQADAKALLVWNQNHLEYQTDAASRTAVLKILESLLSKNVPVQALGIQAHLTAQKFPFDARSLSNFVNEVSGMGLKILITEMDVTDKYVHGSQKIVDQAVADEYSRFLAPALDNNSVIAVMTWGLSDKYTWLSSYAPRDDKQPVRSLPLDANMNPKPAFYAIADAFDHAPKR
jgi:endo-1,4-beta-xylanase